MSLPAAISVCLMVTLPNSLSLELSENDLSTFLLLLPWFERSSFWSSNDINLRTCTDSEPFEPSETESGGVRHNRNIICTKYMKRAEKQATPQIRKSPQKLLSWSWSDSSSVESELQTLCNSHLSWIRWRSPFSDSCRMAVDKSTANGESRGKACNAKDKRKKGSNTCISHLQ